MSFNFHDFVIKLCEIVNLINARNYILAEKLLKILDTPGDSSTWDIQSEEGIILFYKRMLDKKIKISYYKESLLNYMLCC